jgi:thymidylate kinase
MKFAKILCIEGGDKMGKETQTKMLVSHLETLGKNVTLVEVPYDDGMTHDIIYKMLKSGSAKDKPYVFQFVHFINKMIFQVCKLPTLLLKNDYVVLGSIERGCLAG